MIESTTKSGSPLPTYLTQTPKTSFQIGMVKVSGNVIWGYSGLVNFDLSVAASYPLITFTLERNAMIKAQFSCDFDVLDTSGIATGFQISIDNISTFEWTCSRANQANGSDGNNPVPEFFLPAGRNCNIIVLNPDSGADLLQANISIVGQYV